MLEQLLEVILILLLADLITGVFHWIEDTYFLPSSAIVGPIILENEQHHMHPDKILENGDWATIKRTVQLIALPSLILLWIFPSWQSGLLVLLLSLSNLIHKWAHKNPSAYQPTWIWALRTIGLLDYSHHHRHHQSLLNNYCILTRWLNPLLESLGFWRKLESVIPYTPREGRFKVISKAVPSHQEITL